VSEVLAVNGTIPATPTIRTISTAFVALNGMKVDANGNIFLASGSAAGTDNAVYEILAVNGSIPASPTILTLGSGFTSPTGVAIDLSGNVFVSDENANAVYEMLAVNGVIPASPVVRTLGSGFVQPTNVALDDAGNVYVADYGNHAIKKILAVNGSVPATNPTILSLGSGFVSPQGLYVDGSGNVFVADSGFSQAVRLDYSTAPTLNFATTIVGSTSTDSPQTVTLTNDGNTSLTIVAISVPGAGNNPAITPGFTLSSSSTCPHVSPAGTAKTLPAGASCTQVISFTPIAAGPDNGKLVLTDDNLNIPGSTQTILLNGNGLLAPTIVFTVPNHTYGDAPFTVAATSNSPGAFTYSVVSGPATIAGSTVTLTGAGIVILRASQAATGTFAAGTQDASFTVFKEPQTISFTAPASPVTYGSGPITLSASASSGLAVTFSILSGPATLSGNVLTTTGIGTIVIAADQPGDANYAAAPQVTHTITVNGAIPTITLTASPNPVFLLNPVRLTATATSASITPTGSVTFYDGATPLGTLLLTGGTATLSVSNFGMGTHTITAQYNGGTGFLPATSPSVLETVQDFSLTMISGDQVIPHGGRAVYTFAVTPIGGATMPAEINFKVSGEPSTSAITFAPATASAGSSITTVTLTIQTPNYPVGPWNISMAKETALLAFLAAGGLLLPFRNRRRIHLLLLLVSMTLIALSGCGSGWNTQRYTVAVTASSGALAHTASAALTSR
ncbi:MAG TPA: Ig-like domain repeat protein, partial [Acidobacteriaceae bacterium]